MITFLEPEFTHGDERGSLRQLVSGGWSQVNVIQSAAGTVRGNHWHEQTREMFFCVSGGFKLTLEKNGEKQEHQIGAGAFFHIDPGVRHTFAYDQDSVIVALYDRGVQLEDGTLDIHS
ncbi:cupin domain-containing protein [Azospirillum rugosum]|uniref:dTDP-4-dehydrorhamnose 3,5-epimerase-like enzyme n=1 Tax=Azospirillum rugosum TaxID=416170 RepID=A0ABS4SNW9_9PROT|nr:cupin domain-containing protein [Azospirillum rugosum]MBP2294253.1 dTDP-4-dehydrorhamnose 3,5-epimerase-like enzyme [Azospirillum rugosum]MDQ0527588.1 dTDP-4-dehydrorhamnose 3,5-epimerase-like enzyme [Azospirillum rugosum]